jgi:nitroreductase
MSDQSDPNRTDAPEHLSLLRSLISIVPDRLMAISADRAAEKAALKQWSNKEELGHLIDSASNNHQRIVRAQLEDSPAMPGYDGDAWVELHGYQSREWQSLIELWRSGNIQLLSAAEAAGPEAWRRTLTVGGSDLLSLRFVFDDYVEHMLSHLAHIGLDAAKARSESDDPATLYPEKPARADRPINQLMRRRWSPRAFEEREVERSRILTLLEAARWAPSCFNEQPWRYLVFDGSDREALERARACLVEGNAWALKLPVLMVSVARNNFSKNEAPNRTAQHDVGLASEDLVLQAVELGLAAHQMAGFDVERTRSEFGIPEDYTPIAMIAVGYPYRGDLGALPESLQAKELAGRSRKPIGEIAFGGKWGEPYDRR